MPKLTAAELKELFDIVADIKAVRLDFCLSAAERTLRGIVSNTVYEQSETVNQIESLKFAEAHLAVYHLLLNTGARIRRSGLIKQEQDAGGSVTNNVSNQFFTPEEIAALRKSFYQAAIDAAEPFQPTAPVKLKTSSPVISGGWAI